MESRSRCFERLMVIRDDVPRAGALNMALDEVCLRAAASEPILRLYSWAGPTVSFGHFEPAADARRVARGREIVRRWTGGGIVEHGEDFTYSLLVPRGEPFCGLRPAESYRRIHDAVAVALAAGGVATEAVDRPTGSTARPAGENACFVRPVLHDLLSDGAKVAGAAQRRTRTGLLHQGSIRLAPTAAADRADWRHCLHQTLPEALAGSWEMRFHSAERLKEAEELAASRYASAAWTDRF